MPEDIDQLSQRPAGPLVVVTQEVLRDFARKTRARGDEALGVLGEGFFVDARLVVETFQVANRRKTHQVAVAGAILRQQELVVAIAPRTRVRPVPPGAGGQVRLHADDRLQARFARLAIKLHRAEHVSVVRHRYRSHSELAAVRDQPLDPRRAVEQGKVAVVV